MTETFESFVRQYGRADGQYEVIDVGDIAEQWPTVVVRFGDKTAVVQFCGVGADGDAPHLSIDVHAFVADRLALSSVFGMENGGRYTGFDHTAPGTSHGWPAVQGLTVLVGAQTTRKDDR